MALNVTGYPLEFDAVINTDGLSAGVKSVKDNVNNLTDPLKSALAGVDKNLEDLLTNIRKLGGDPALEQLFTKYANLQKQQLTLQDTLSKTTDPTQIADLNKQLQQTGVEMKEVADQTALLSQPVDKVTQAYTRLRQIKNELVEITLAGGKGSPEFEKLNEEAEKLTNAIKNTNRELALSAHNVAGLEALKEGVRGLVGGFEAVSGAIVLFGGDSKQAEEATKAVIGAMGILNGVEEVAALLSKNSAVNFYLQGLAHKSAAVAAGEQAVATQALAVAEGEEAVAAETATVAQKGLNAALLANPVALILASVVALYGAYEIYTRTLGKASDAEKEQASALQNTKDVQDKAIEGYAKEEAQINSMVSSAKNELLTRGQRQQAIDELKQAYPGYLSNLSLENIYTDKGAELIEKQINLIKQKAIAVASESIYADKIKAQVQAQSDLDLLIKKQNDLRAAGASSTVVDAVGKLVTESEEKLKDATIDANTAFDSQAKAAQTLAEAHQSDAEKLKIYIEQLDKFSSKSEGFVQQIAKMAQAGAKLKLQSASTEVPFDPKAFEDEKKKLLENAQYQIDLDKQSFAAKRNLIQTTYDEELKRIDGLFGSDANSDAALQARKVAYGKYFSDINELNQQQRSRNYQDEVAAAEALVLRLEAEGKKGTDAYYDAKIKAIRAAANEAIHQEGITAGEIKRINAQLALDLENISVDRRKSQLQVERDTVASQLDLVKQGTSQELSLKIKNIQLAADQELTEIGLTQQKKTEILTKAAKEISDLNRAFIVQDVKDEQSIRISSLQTQLSGVEKGTREELELKKKLIDDQRSLEILGVFESVKNEELKVAKIAEINAKARVDQLKLDNEFFAQELKNQLTAIDKSSAPKIQRLQFTISDPNTNLVDSFNAQKAIIDQEIADTDRKLTAVSQQLIRGHGDAAELGKELDALDQKSRGLQNQKDVLASQEQIIHLKQVATEVGKINSSFSALSRLVRNLNDNFAEIVETISQVSQAANIAANSLAQIKKGQIENQNKAGSGFGDVVGGAVGVFGSFFSVVNTINDIFSAAAKKRAELKAQDEQLLNNVVVGEVAINDEYRKRLVIQAQINKLKLEGLAAEAEALRLNSESTINDFNRVLKEIRDRGKVAIPEGFTAEQIDFIKNLEGIGGSNDLTKAFDAATSLAGKSFDELQKLFLEGRLDESASKLFQTLEQLKNEGIDIDKALEENKAKAQEIFTGTTSDAILDSIVQAFADGKRATADFADNFQDLMRKSILNSFKFNALEKPIQDFYTKFAAAAQTDNTLSQAEIQDLQKQYDQIIRNAGLQFDQLSKLTSVDLTGTADSNTLKGAIKGITEQQAELLAGQFGGLRLTAIEQMNIARESLGHLSKIADNTARIAAVEDFLRKFYNEGIKIQ
jgi:hypothetical protein